MAHKVIEIDCPGCGARVSTDQKQCDWCKGPIIISTFNSIDSLPLPKLSSMASNYAKSISANPDNQELHGSVAMCNLKLCRYNEALASFERAIEGNFDNSEFYFYAAVCLLQGKKAFLHTRSTIDKVLEYLNAAVMIEPRGIYYYFMAYVKYDYFTRKYLRVSPDYKELLAMAKRQGYSDYDVRQLFTILKVEKPAVLV